PRSRGRPPATNRPPAGRGTGAEGYEHVAGRGRVAQVSGERGGPGRVVARAHHRVGTRVVKRQRWPAEGGPPSAESDVRPGSAAPRRCRGWRPSTGRPGGRSR